MYVLPIFLFLAIYGISDEKEHTSKRQDSSAHTILHGSWRRFLVHGSLSLFPMKKSLTFEGDGQGVFCSYRYAVLGSRNPNKKQYAQSQCCM